MAQLIEAGVYLITRGRTYQLLERPQLQRVLAHPPSKKVTVGKKIGEWVYELFITTLPVEGFLLEDVLDRRLMDVGHLKRSWPTKMLKKIPIDGVWIRLLMPPKCATRL
jgi:hypothetical protein